MHRLLNHLVRDGDTMVLFIITFQALQDRDCVFERRLLDDDRLEATFECRVFFDMLAVFVHRRRTDKMELTPRQRRLQHIGSIERALSGARSSKQVKLIDKHDDIFLAFELINDFFQTLLKLAPVFRAGNHGGEIELYDTPVEQMVRDFLARNSLRQSFDDCRLTDARLTYQDGVVLCAAAQYRHHPFLLLITADHRVELACSCFRRQIRTECVKRSATTLFRSALRSRFFH